MTPDNTKPENIQASIDDLIGSYSSNGCNLSSEVESELTRLLRLTSYKKMHSRSSHSIYRKRNEDGSKVFLLGQSVIYAYIEKGEEKEFIKDCRRVLGHHNGRIVPLLPNKATALGVAGMALSGITGGDIWDILFAGAFLGGAGVLLDYVFPRRERDDIQHLEFDKKYRPKIRYGVSALMNII